MSQEQKTQDKVMSLLLEYGYNTDLKVAGVTLVLGKIIEDLKERVIKLEEEK